MRMRYFLGAMVTILFTFSALANDTLNKIKQSGTIYLGVRDTSIPFSYLDNHQQYVGYSVDLCTHIITSIQKKLNLATLHIKKVPVHTSNRIPLIANGTIDLSCDVTIYTKDRAERVGFSTPIFFVNNALVAKKNTGIKTVADLKGKSVVVLAGSVNLQTMVAQNKTQQLGIKILTVKDSAEAFLMVETGRAAAFAQDDILLKALIAQAKTPQDYILFDGTTPLGSYGLLFRKNDASFKKIVDDTLRQLFQSGEIKPLYAKWFERPLAPKGMQLNWPMPAQLKQAYQ